MGGRVGWEGGREEGAMMIILSLDCIRDTHNLNDKYVACGMFEIILNIKDHLGVLFLW